MTSPRTPETSAWIVPGRSVREGEARVHLFCLGHAGGEPGFFRRWGAALGPEIAVSAIALPGRGPRQNEAPATRMEQVVGPLLEVLRAHAGVPMALFGHSMGAAIGYELARRMPAEGLGVPLHLFVSGRRAPHCKLPHSPYHELSDHELAEVLIRLNGTPADILGDDDFLRRVLPCVRADFELLETWAPSPEPRVACPLWAFAGRHDPEVSQVELLEWQSVAASAFRATFFPGDHFYLKGALSDLLSLLRRQLLPEVASPAGRLARSGDSC